MDPMGLIAWGLWMFSTLILLSPHPTKITAPLTLLHHQAKEVPFGVVFFCWGLLLEWLLIDLYGTGFTCYKVDPYDRFK